MECLESEYVRNGSRKLDGDDVVQIGVNSLLDSMPSQSRGRPPALNTLLSEHAFMDGNTATLDYYLGDRHTKTEEAEFKCRLNYLKEIFDSPMDEARASYVAEYMMGPIKESGGDEDDDTGSEDGREVDVEVESESESSESEPEPEPPKRVSKPSRYQSSSTRKSKRDEESESSESDSSSSDSDDGDEDHSSYKRKTPQKKQTRRRY